MNPATELPLTIAFKNIALLFSAAGFCAVSFSLGTLSYVKQLKLNFDVEGNPTDKSSRETILYSYQTLSYNGKGTQD